MAEPAPDGRDPRTGAGSESGDNSNHGSAAISRSQPSGTGGVSAVAAVGGREESASEEHDDDDENEKGGEEGYLYAPQRQRDDEETRRAAQSLLCHEKIEEFVDPTLFQRLVAPSAASLAAEAAAAAASAEEEAAAVGRANDASRKRALWPVAHGQIPPYHQPRGSFGSISTAAEGEEGESESAAPPPAKRPATAKRRPSHPGTSASHANSAAAAPSVSAPVSNPYMHSWEALELGSTRGTAAWNRALVQALHSQTGGNPADRVPQLTSEEALDVVRSRCRLRTIRPPQGSPVVQPMPPSSSSSTAPASGGPDAAAAAAAVGAAGGSSPSPEDEEAATDCQAAADRAWFVRTLSELHGAMVAQDSVAGAAAQRYVEATAGDVLEKLRQVENDRARLELREERVLALSRQLGLLTRETRVESLRMRGIVRDDVDADLDAVGGGVAGAEEEEESAPGATKTTKQKEKSASISRRGTYWRQDFDRLLEERRSQGAETFLFPHDAY